MSGFGSDLSSLLSRGTYANGGRIDLEVNMGAISLSIKSFPPVFGGAIMLVVTPCRRKPFIVSHVLKAGPPA